MICTKGPWCETTPWTITYNVHVSLSPMFTVEATTPSKCECNCAQSKTNANNTLALIKTCGIETLTYKLNTFCVYSQIANSNKFLQTGDDLPSCSLLFPLSAGTKLQSKRCTVCHSLLVSDVANLPIIQLIYRCTYRNVVSPYTVEFTTVWMYKEYQSTKYQISIRDTIMSDKWI